MNRVFARAQRCGAIALAATLSCVAALFPSSITASASADFSTTSQEQQFVPLTPSSLLDTRYGVGASTAKVPAQASITFQVAGRGGVPASGVSAVAMSLSSANTTKSGWFTMYPSDQPTTVSTLTFAAGENVTAQDFTRLTSTGKVTVVNKSDAPVDIAATVRGYFLDAASTSAGNKYYPLASKVLHDTRPGNAVGTPAKTTPLGSEQKMTIDVAGKLGIPASGANAVAINIVATGTHGSRGWLKAYPSDQAEPQGAVAEYSAGQDGSSFTVAQLSSTGKLTVLNHGSGTTDISISVRGYFKGAAATDGATYQPVATTIALETLTGQGVPDGGTEPLGPGESMTFDVSGATDVEADRISAAAINVNARRPTARGWLSVFPAGAKDPGISSVNFAANESTNGFDLAIPGNGGSLTIANHSEGDVHLQVSVRGYAIKPAPEPVAPSAPPSAEVTAAIQRVNETGTISSEDRATITSSPEYADLVIDPDATTMEGEDFGDAPNPGPDPTDDGDMSGAATRKGCHRADRYNSYRSVLGKMLFKWHHVVHYCWDGRKVTKILERNHYLSNKDVLFKDGGMKVNTQSGIRTSNYYSTMQGHVEGCVPYIGCYNNFSPYIRYNMHGNGRYDIRQVK